MSTTASRTQSNGIFLANGELDEYTSQGDVSFENRVTASDVTVTGILDEVTYNTTSTLTSGGRYNLISYSNYFAYDGSLGWRNIFPLGATVTTGIDAPDGSLTAMRFSCNNTTSALLRVQMTSFTPNGSDTYTMSFYARHVSGSKTGCTSDLQDGVGFTYSNSLITGTWVRITYSGVPTATAKTFLDLFSDSNTNNVIDYWGVQVENSTTATILQPIANNTVTPTMASRIDSGGNFYVSGGFDETSGTIVQDGLLLYMNAWPKTYSGGTTWLDLGPQQNNATLNGNPTYSATEGGGSLAFTGAQDGAVSSALLNVTYTGKTVFAVARMNSAGWTPGMTQYRALFGTNGAVGTRNFNFYVLHNASNTYQFHFSALGTANNSGNVTGMIDDTWFIAAVTVTSNTITYYFNGTQVSSAGGFTLNQYQTTTSEFIGRADNYWYGDIAAIALYTRALSADEIAANYQAFAGRVGL